MYSVEQREAAVELLIKNNYDYSRTVGMLGYPNESTLRFWLRQHEHSSEIPEERMHIKGRYTGEQKRTAVEYYLKHDKSAGEVVRMLGYPSAQCLLNWVDELAPGARSARAEQGNNSLSFEDKAAAVVVVGEKRCRPKEVAEKLGVSREALYNWRKQLLSTTAGDSVTKEDEGASLEELEAQVSALRVEVRALELQKAILEGTLEIVKKDPGTDPKRLSNAEKAELVNSLRGEWKLRELLEAVDMAKSSYEYAVHALERGESESRAAARQAVVAAFEEAGGKYGYRRVLKAIDAGDGPHVGEWTVRSIMREEGLSGKASKKKRRYSSYEGETSEAPENLLRNEDGTHDFRADAPNETWVTDVTEFAIPEGKVYLSPIIDCFDGMPLSWTISTSPNAEMANSSLLGACEWLGEGDSPVVHSDRGCHYRWPGWIAICEEKGLVRSMSRKGCSPDNARAEGFFGRLKVEFFYDVDWSGVSIEQFTEMLDAHLRWYREKRIKSDLGYKSPMQYRRDLGLLAA
ncbi:MAG: IS3 family transposase [Coriobacteriales bacterium]